MPGEIARQQRRPQPPGRLGRDDRLAAIRYRSRPRVQATRIRPDTRPTDLRRLAAAGTVRRDPGPRSAVQRSPPPGRPVPRPVADPARPRRPARPRPVTCPPGGLGRVAAGDGHAAGPQRRQSSAGASGRRPGVPRYAPDRPDRAARYRSASSSSPSRWSCRTSSSTATGPSWATPSTGSSAGPYSERATRRVTTPDRSRATASGSTSCSSASTSGASERRT